MSAPITRQRRKNLLSPGLLSPIMSVQPNDESSPYSKNPIVSRRRLRIPPKESKIEVPIITCSETIPSISTTCMPVPLSRNRRPPRSQCTTSTSSMGHAEDDPKSQNSDSSPNPEFFTPPSKTKPTACSTLERNAQLKLFPRTLASEAISRSIVGLPPATSSPSKPELFIGQHQCQYSTSAQSPFSSEPSPVSQEESGSAHSIPIPTTLSPFRDPALEAIPQHVFASHHVQHTPNVSYSAPHCYSTIDISAPGPCVDGHSMSHKCNMVADFSNCVLDVSRKRIFHSTIISHRSRTAHPATHPINSSSKLDFGAGDSLFIDDFSDLGFASPGPAVDSDSDGDMCEKKARLSQNPSIEPRTELEMCEKTLDDSLQIYRRILLYLQPQYQQATTEAWKVRLEQITHEDIFTPASESDHVTEGIHSKPQRRKDTASVSAVDVLGYRGLAHYSVLAPVTEISQGDRILCAQERLGGGLKAIHQFTSANIPEPSSSSHPHSRVIDPGSSGNNTATSASSTSTVVTRQLPSGRKHNKWESRLLKWLYRRRLSNEFWSSIILNLERDRVALSLTYPLPGLEDIFRDRSSWCASQPYCHGGSLVDWFSWLAQNHAKTPSSTRRGVATSRSRGHPVTTWDQSVCHMVGRLFFDIAQWLHYLHTRVGLTLHGQWAQGYKRALIASHHTGKTVPAYSKHLERLSGLHPGLVLIKVDEFTADDLQSKFSLIQNSTDACRLWREELYENMLRGDWKGMHIEFVVYNLGRARTRQQLQPSEHLFSASCLKDWLGVCHILLMALSFVRSSEASAPFYAHIRTLLQNGSGPTREAVENVVQSLHRAGYGSM